MKIVKTNINQYIKDNADWIVEMLRKIINNWYYKKLNFNLRWLVDKEDYLMFAYSKLYGFLDFLRENKADFENKKDMERRLWGIYRRYNYSVFNQKLNQLKKKSLKEIRLSCIGNLNEPQHEYKLFKVIA